MINALLEALLYCLAVALSLLLWGMGMVLVLREKTGSKQAA
jgi:hypothetical protein